MNLPLALNIAKLMGLDGNIVCSLLPLLNKTSNEIYLTLADINYKKQC